MNEPTLGSTIIVMGIIILLVQYQVINRLKLGEQNH